MRAVDPFDLPEWLGTGEVTWTALTSVHGGHLVSGELSGDGQPIPCDLLGADEAFPLPVLDDDWRRRVHQTWTFGQVLLVEYGGRLTLAVPGTSFSADRALEAVGRLAKAVGVVPGRFVAALRL
ncbi:MAG: hypothetical protein ACXVW6_07590 [Nocardioidaceae bacterium]